MLLQAYCILVMRYYPVAGDGQIRFQISRSIDGSIATVFFVAEPQS